MKKRGPAVLILCLLCAISLILCSRMERSVLLGEEYPALAEGSYRAAILWDGIVRDNNIELAVSDAEFREILASARVTERPKSEQAPSLEFLIHSFGGPGAYSIAVGGDRSISVAEIADLAGTRTFWTDRDGQVFSKIYACHLNNGGEEIPKEITARFLKR